jgi:peptidyl-prolyl cis-trans isomerase A (cyclophilin A)
MKKIRILIVFIVLTGVIMAMILLIPISKNQTLPKVSLKTELGNIEIEVFADKAPVTAANFLKYVDEKRYTRTSFYRVVTPDNQPNDSIRIQVIQGGLGFEENDQSLPPIPHETTKETGILHKDGTISMARLQPGTASSEFFICIKDQPELDYGGKRNPDGQGFAAFGRVIRGMEVVMKIQLQSEEGQMLKVPVEILDIYRTTD